jgi:FkbM family methyltransferase
VATSEHRSSDASHRRSRPVGLVARALDRALLKARAMLGISEPLYSGDVRLTLSPGHTLGINQRHFPLYDRFLPHLASHLDRGSTVIDVGANCGDTLAGMYAANPSLKFVAVEPNDIFFALLEKNVATLSAAKGDLRVDLVKSLVGKQVTGATMVGSGGTAKAVVHKEHHQTHQSRTMDDILSTLGIDDVRLLKSDVDGFDYDVIESARETMARSKPLAFFETQIDHDFQRQGFSQVFGTLEELGYSYWLLFDNFGSLCVRTGDSDVARQLVDYPWRNRCSVTRRTVNYFDVLAATEADRSFVDAVADSYEQAVGAAA